MKVSGLIIIAFVLGTIGTMGSGCAQAYKSTLGGVPETFHRIYLTDFNTAWQSVQDSLKSVRLDVSNRESGFIQTRWTDNTLEKNFAERGTFMKAQYRLLVSVAKSFYNGVPAVKVTIQREQLIQRDVLEGWKPMDTDSVEEKTMLYRVGRLIYIKTRIGKIEEDKNRRAIEQSGF